MHVPNSNCLHNTWFLMVIPEAKNTKWCKLHVKCVKSKFLSEQSIL